MYLTQNSPSVFWTVQCTCTVGPCLHSCRAGPMLLLQILLEHEAGSIIVLETPDCTVYMLSTMHNHMNHSHLEHDEKGREERDRDRHSDREGERETGGEVWCGVMVDEEGASRTFV